MDKRKRRLLLKDNEEEVNLGEEKNDNNIKNMEKINKKIKKNNNNKRNEEKLINLVMRDKAIQ